MSAATTYQPVTASMGDSAEKNATATGSAVAPPNSGLWNRIINKLPFLGTKRGLTVTIVAILVIIGGGLAGLAALRNRSGDDGTSGTAPGATNSSNAISSDAHFFGQSPAVYPSRGSSHSPLIAESVTNDRLTHLFQQTLLAQEHGLSRSNAPRQWWQT